MRFYRKLIAAAALSAALLAPQWVLASGAVTPPSQTWEFAGVFGKFDQDALKRGAKVAMEVCLNCHSIKYIKFDQLRQIGFSEEEVKAFAEAKGVTKKDRMRSAMDDQSAKDVFNIIPPDLSLMTKARKGFEDYLYGILNGYLNDEEAKLMEEAAAAGGLTEERVHKIAEMISLHQKDPAKLKEEVAHVAERVKNGENFNKYFPGYFFAMPKPLNAGEVEYPAGVTNSLEQMSHDVTAFLAWAAEPTLMERKSVGKTVMIYLFVLTIMLFALKRRIWARIEH